MLWFFDDNARKLCIFRVSLFIPSLIKNTQESGCSIVSCFQPLQFTNEEESAKAFLDMHFSRLRQIIDTHYSDLNSMLLSSDNWIFCYTDNMFNCYSSATGVSSSESIPSQLVKPKRNSLKLTFPSLSLSISTANMSKVKSQEKKRRKKREKGQTQEINNKSRNKVSTY